MHDSLAAYMARDVRSGAFFEREVTDAQRADFEKFQADMEGLSASQRDAFAEVIAYGLLVSAASSLLSGERTRRLVLFGMFHSARHSATQRAAIECRPTPQHAVDVALEIASDFGARRQWSPAPAYAA
jgi:hypothetical protein